MATINDKDDYMYLWELAALYMDFLPSSRLRFFQDCANPLTDLDAVEFYAQFRVMEQSFADSLTTLKPCTWYP